MAGRLIRGLTLALLTGGLVLASGSSANACSCAGLGDGDLFLLTDAVFTGRAVEPLGEGAWRFEVEDVYKGAVYEVQVVHGGGPGDTCAYRFHAGDRYQVFANTDDDVLSTGICSGTRSLASASVYAPTTAAQPQPGESGEDGTPLWLIATDVLMVLVALIALVLGPRLWRGRKRDGD